MAKLEVGKEYVDLTRKDGMRLVYIGPGPSHEVFSADGSTAVVQVMRNRVARDVVEWNGDRHRPLEPGQLWERTRHDYAGQIAEVVIPPFESNRDTWVVYRVHYGSGSPNPQIKTEKDFRRIFGRYRPDNA